MRVIGGGTRPEVYPHFEERNHKLSGRLSKDPGGLGGFPPMNREQAYPMANRYRIETRIVGGNPPKPPG